MKKYKEMSDEDYKKLNELLETRRELSRKEAEIWGKLTPLLKQIKEVDEEFDEIMNKYQ